MALVAAGVALYGLSGSTEDAAERTVAAPTAHVGTGSVATRLSPPAAERGPASATSSVLASPFGRGAPPLPRPMAERVAERKQHMKALGINTSDEYHNMPFAQLRQRAAQHDVMAMLQLAMQYGSESADLEREADYDANVDPQQEQKKYLAAAVNAGHIRSAAILARLHWQDGTSADAYAWQLLAERLGDSSGSQWAHKTFSNMSAADRLAAEQKAQALYQQATLRFFSPAGVRP